MRELYNIKEYRAVFCLEAREALGEEKLHILGLNTEKAVAAGLYDFLPCPPLVISRTFVRDNTQHVSHLGGDLRAWWTNCLAKR